MDRAASVPCLDKLDLKDVALILRAVYPGYSLCQCARMAAAFAPSEACECSLCPPGVFPGCVRGAAAAKPESVSPSIG